VPRLPRPRWPTTRTAAAALAVGLTAVMLGPAAYAVATAGQAEAGAIPRSGPAAAASAGSLAGPGGGSARVARLGPGGGGPQAQTGPPADVGGGADRALLSYLKAHQGNATWLVATGSAQSAASIELATGRPALAMGGFSGSDPAMTAARLQQLVRSGQLRYVLLGGGGPDASGQSVATWVRASCTLVDFSAGGSSQSSLYDCSTAAGPAA
jgi:hypothetical protein